MPYSIDTIENKYIHNTYENGFVNYTEWHKLNTLLLGHLTGNIQRPFMDIELKDLQVYRFIQF